MPNHVTTRCTVTGPLEDIERFRAACILKDPDDDDGRLFLDFNVIIPMPEAVKGTVSGSNADLGVEILTGHMRPRVFGSSYLAYPWIQKLGIETIEQLKAWAEKEHPEALIQGQKAIDAHKETGFYDWYDWSIANWGTKWNSYDFGIDECDLGVEILTGHMKPPVFETIEQLKAWVERSIANWGTKWIGIDEPIAGVLRFRFDTAWSFPEPVFNKLADDYPTLKFECVCYDEGSNFAGEGFFNGEPEFATCEATDELYERVYGHQREDEDETTDNDR